MNTLIRTLGVIFLLSVLGGCKKSKPDTLGGNFLIFYPREASHLITIPLKEIKHTKKLDNGKDFTSIEKVGVDTEGVSAKDFRMYISTGTKGLIGLKELYYQYPSKKNVSFLSYLYQDKQANDALAPKNISLERMMDIDFRSEDNKSRSAESVGAAMFPWEYRVTGVKDFRITANSTLFGVPAGSSLNKYFRIHEFEPRQIISHRTQALVWGYRDKREIESLEQWLSLSPMAPPVMILRLNATPQEVPIDVELQVALETIDGKIIRDKLQVLLK